MSSRRHLTVIASAATLTVGAVVTALAVTVPSVLNGSGGQSLSAIRQSHCLSGQIIAVTADGDYECSHADAPPRGVDVTKPVATKVLEARQGPQAAAANAAQDEGVVVPATAAATTNKVVCEGDGDAGYRVQAMYVTTSDKANRYPALYDQIKTWAAGVDTVFNLSAAKTGGVRHVRYVTDAAGDGTCTAKVLNVTVPPGSFASFNATITAVRNAGFTAPNRKYLMWVDGTGQCGIANLYTNSRADQANPNNGSYPQYSRIDTGCWGFKDSVEAHELAHNLGSVMADAPHATAAGHCFDESDRMCYADGGGKAMQQICPADQDALLDCHDDDYFSTYPQGGSYLATHWNVASSRFLIGGGDGAGGGSLGVVTRLGGILSVNNPAVPGLPTNTQIALELPAGRTATVAWTTPRADCVFADPTARATTVTCSAGTATPVAVTATVTDSTGEKLVRTSSVTFDKTARRTATSVLIDGSASTYTPCPSGKGLLSAKVTDVASGAGVKNIQVTWFRKTGSAPAVRVTTGISRADGVAVSTAIPVTAGDYTAVTAPGLAFPVATSGVVTATAPSGPCTVGVTAAADRSSVQAGDTVTVTGTLTRTAPGGSALPAAGETVGLSFQPSETNLARRLVSATTAVDGSFTMPAKLLTSGSLQVVATARTGMGGALSTPAAITVRPWTTALTLSPSASSLMAQEPVTVTGLLTQSDGTTATPMGSTLVTVAYPVSGGSTSVVTARTAADGTYKVVVKPTGSGALTASYRPVPGWSAATATTALSVSPWTTSTTLSLSSRSVGTPTVLTGVVTATRTNGQSVPLKSVPVLITYPVAGGRTTAVIARTSSTGTYSLKVTPAGAGDVKASYAGTPGWTASASAPVRVG